MRHAACRQALLDGDLNPEVAEHLDRCERCLAFSHDLGQISEFAASVAPPPAPEGLSSRILAHVRAHADDVAADESSGSGTGEPDPTPALAPVLDLDRESRRERAFRHLATRRGPAMVTLSAAAVLILLVGVLAAVAPRGSSRNSGDPLLAAAHSTLDASTARVRLSGSATASVDLPTERVTPRIQVSEAFGKSALPDFERPPTPVLPDDLPEDLRAQMEAQYEDFADDLSAYYSEIQQLQQESYEQLRQNADDVFAALDLPDGFEFEAEISGEGAVAFPNQMSLSGAMEVVQSEPQLPQTGADFAVVVTDDGTFFQNPDGSWVRIPGGAGPLGAVVADADGVADLLSSAEGDVEDLGETELDGEPVRHYRFAVAPSLFGGSDVTTEAEAEAWVGRDDGILRRLTTTTDSTFEDDRGFRGRYSTTMTVELFDFGAEVDVTAPEAAADADSPFGLGALLAPYESSFGSSVYYGLETSVPIPPTMPDTLSDVPTLSGISDPLAPSSDPAPAPPPPPPPPPPEPAPSWEPAPSSPQYEPQPPPPEYSPPPTYDSTPPPQPQPQP